MVGTCAQGSWLSRMLGGYGGAATFLFGLAGKVAVVPRKVGCSMSERDVFLNVR